MLSNRTKSTWMIALRNADTGAVVSASRVPPESRRESFVLSVPCKTGLKRYTDVTITDDGVYFDGVQAGTRRNGVTFVKFLDSGERAEFQAMS